MMVPLLPFQTGCESTVHAARAGNEPEAAMTSAMTARATRRGATATGTPEGETRDIGRPPERSATVGVIFNTPTAQRRQSDSGRPDQAVPAGEHLRDRLSRALRAS